jgi:hypothetical protein
LRVEILAPGFVVKPWTGKGARFERATFRDPAGRQVEGFKAELSAQSRIGSGDLAYDRAVVVAQALLDLTLRWPLAEPQIRVFVDEMPVRRSRDISKLQHYEIGAILGGAPGLPRTQFTISPDVPPRIELLWSCAMVQNVRALDRLVGPLSQASAAAAARHPFDRVTGLWAALELLYASARSDLARIDQMAALDPASAGAEVARAGPALKRLLSFRRQLAKDTWIRESVRRRLEPTPRSGADRAVVATVVAYAVRSKIVHGQWARYRDDRRLEAGAAENWLWQLLEREVELRLVGRRLDARVPDGAPPILGGAVG